MGMWRIKMGIMQGIRVGMRGIRVRMGEIRVGIREIEWNRNRK